MKAQAEPASQGADALDVQRLEPDREKVPAAHGTQEAGALAYVPAGQEVDVYAQEDAPPTLKSPAAQLKHAALDVLLVYGLKVPAGQGDSTPSGQKEPCGQAAQAAAPGAAEKLPLGQGVGTVL